MFELYMWSVLNKSTGSMQGMFSMMNHSICTAPLHTRLVITAEAVWSRKQPTQYNAGDWSTIVVILLKLKVMHLII